MGRSAFHLQIPSVWTMPVCPEQYDRRPLSATEQEALAVLSEGYAPMNSVSRREAQATLARLYRPLHAVYALRRQDPSCRPLATSMLCRQMHRRVRAFWKWSPQDWLAVMETSPASFATVNDLHGGGKGLRPHLLDVAYLLCGFDEFGPLWTATALHRMARVVFGTERVAIQLARIDVVLAPEGYATGQQSLKQRYQAVSFLLLVYRSPWLEDLTPTAVDRANEMAPEHR